jgi:lipopolysaccharide transport system permease protein
VIDVRASLHVLPDQAVEKSFSMAFFQWPVYSLECFVKSLLSFLAATHLVRQFTWRLVQAKYRGSLLGLGWAFLNPLLSLTLFTFVFHSIFSMRWSGGVTHSPWEFALFLFVGLLVFQAVAEVLGRSPEVIVGQPNLVTKVVFPLWVLPLSLTLAVLVQMGVGFVVLLVWAAFVFGVSWSWLWLPVVLLPVILGMVGVAWLLSALGVYVRDLGQVMSMLATFLMFVSPVFYPIASVPEAWQGVFALNPLAGVMEALRSCVLLHRPPEILSLLYVGLHGVFWFAFGGWVFARLKRGFADVL